MINMTTVGDLGSALVWLAVTAGILVSLYRLVLYFFPRDTNDESILHLAVLFVATLLIFLYIVNAFGMLARLPILFAASVAAWLIRIYVLRRRSIPGNPPDSNSGRLYDWAVITKRPTSERVVQSSWVWKILIPIFIGHIVTHGIFKMPTDFDTLVYHLPFMDFWLQEGTLASQSSARWSTPGNSELIGLWFVAPFSGDFLFSLNNAAILVVLVASILVLSKQLGLSPSWQAILAVGCMAVRPVFNEAIDARNDLMVVGFFMAGIVYLLRFATTGSQTDAIFFGLCVGIVAGTKYFAVGYAAVLVTTFACVGGWNQGVRQTLQSILVAMFAGLATGGYWFIRNFWLTGYALYPQGSADMKERILHPNLAETTLAFNGNPLLLDLTLEAIWKAAGPFQLIGLAIAPTFLLMCFVESLRRIKHRFDAGQNVESLLEPIHQAWIVVACGLVGSFAVWLVTPMLVEDQPGTLNQLRWGATPVRYGLSFLTLSLVATVAMISEVFSGLSSRWRIIPVLLFGILAIGQFGHHLFVLHQRELLSVIFIAVPVLIGIQMLPGVMSASSVRIWSGSIIIGSAISIGIAVLSFQWHRDFAGHFNHYYSTLMFSNFALRPSSAVVVLDDRVYAFFGSHRQHSVIHPRLYYGIPNLGCTMTERQSEWVVTRKENQRKVYRYSNASEEITASADYQLEKEGRELQLFKFKEVGL